MTNLHHGDQHYKKNNNVDGYLEKLLGSEGDDNEHYENEIDSSTDNSSSDRDSE